MPLDEISYDKVGEFIDECKNTDVRLVKLRDYAFVEPGQLGGGAIGMIGKERLVLTAYAKSKNGEENNKLLRWQETRKAIGMVTVVAGTGEGHASGSVLAEEAKSIKSRLEMEGIQVIDGEWTKDEIEKILRSA